LYEIIFSKTVLKCKNKLYDFAFLTGLLLSTVKNAMKELVMNGFVRIVEHHYSRLAKAYSLNIKIPEKLSRKFSVQRISYKTVNSALSGETGDICA